MPDRPNIVLIITDQQRYDTIAALGFPQLQTPNLDRLVSEGVSFDNCFVNAPSCGPARCSFFSGLYPHSTGMLRNEQLWSQTWVPNLASAGYFTASIGKMHFTPFDVEGQFDYRFNVENKQRGHPYPTPESYRDEWDKALAERGMDKYHPGDLAKRANFDSAIGAFPWEKDPDMHPDNFLGRSAVEWIEGYEREDPLFLEIGFPGPHPPYDPTPDWIARYADTEFPLLPLAEEERASQPPVFRDMARLQYDGRPGDSTMLPPDPTPDQRQRQRRFYMANVSMIDVWIGRIRDSLERRGLLENSVIIFTSDHGDTLTDHYSSQKWTMYDQVVRVPAIVWAPGRFDGGRRIAGQIEWFDLGATILEIAGAEFPDPFEASSLVGALSGEPFAGREFAFSEMGRWDIVGLTTDYMTMVRTSKWKLVHFIDQPHGQLFDLINDPGELRNRFADPEVRVQRDLLVQAMTEWRMRSNATTAGWRADRR
ncbi:MAG: sulfatase-like hydrolase/transferase [Chloroflexi bacterium]|nr:sulfatase-like hydrolase/transferase [Chloroflexota bacterium]MXX65966.1 sulfatase-like hydrolase/transferase [Chloroflexota bacterium]